MYNVMQIHVTRDWLGWGRGTRDCIWTWTKCD